MKISEIYKAEYTKDMLALWLPVTLQQVIQMKQKFLPKSLMPWSKHRVHPGPNKMPLSSSIARK